MKISRIKFSNFLYMQLFEAEAQKILKIVPNSTWNCCQISYAWNFPWNWFVISLWQFYFCFRSIHVYIHSNPHHFLARIFSNRKFFGKMWGGNSKVKTKKDFNLLRTLISNVAFGKLNPLAVSSCLCHFLLGGEGGVGPQVVIRPQKTTSVPIFKTLVDAHLQVSKRLSD